MATLGSRLLNKELLTHHAQSTRTKLRPNLVTPLVSKLTNINDFSLESIKLSLLDSGRGQSLLLTQKSSYIPSLRTSNFRGENLTNPDTVKKEKSTERYQKKNYIAQFFGKELDEIKAFNQHRIASAKSCSVMSTPRRHTEVQVNGGSDVKNYRSNTVEESGKVNNLLQVVNKKERTPLKQAINHIKEQIEGSSFIRKRRGNKLNQAKGKENQSVKSFSIDKILGKLPQRKYTDETSKEPIRKREGVKLVKRKSTTSQEPLQGRYICSLNLDDLSVDPKVKVGSLTELSNRALNFKLIPRASLKPSPINYNEQIKLRGAKKVETSESESRIKSLQTVYEPQKLVSLEAQRQNKKLRPRRQTFNSANNLFSISKTSENERDTKVEKLNIRGDILNMNKMIQSGVRNFISASEETAVTETSKKSEEGALKQDFSSLMERFKKVLEKPDGHKKELIEKARRILEKMERPREN